MTAEQVFSWIGQVLTAGGGGAVVAYAMFQFLGKNWIEHKLARDLEAAKSEIGVLAIRRMRLHDREYIVFPDVWSKLNDAVDSLGAAIVSFRQTPDFNRMSDERLDKWIARSDLSEEEKDHLLNEGDKNKAFNRILDIRDLMKARKDFLEFHKCLRANRIFISPAIKEKLDKIDDLMHSSWIAKKMDWEGFSRGGDTNFLSEALKKYEKEIKPLMLEIEGLVQAKLFPDSQ